MVASSLDVYALTLFQLILPLTTTYYYYLACFLPPSSFAYHLYLLIVLFPIAKGVIATLLR